MPKLLQINTVINSGSTGRIAEEIGLKAISEGWDSYIAYGRRPRPSNSKAIKVGSRVDQVAHLLKTRLWDRHGLGSGHATATLIRKIKEIQPDVIHLHNIHGYYLNYKKLFGYLASSSIPIVWTLHDCWAYTGHCPHYTFAGCDRWKVECHDCPQKRRYPASVFADRSRRNYIDKKNAFTSVDNMNIIAVSEWLKEETEQSFLRKYPVRRIYNGVDTGVFYPRESMEDKYGAGSRFLILGVASVWDQSKGLDEFIKLADILREDEVVVLVGLTKDQISSMPSNIIGIERTDNIEQLAELYSRADVCVSLSVEETFGMTTAESMACGTPVIVYRSTASPELVSDSTGFTAEPHDIDGVRIAIDRIRDKGSGFYKQQCRRHAEKMFDSRDRWSEYMSLYNSLI